MISILVMVSQVLSRDGKMHAVSLYVDIAAEITVNNGTVEEVSWNAFNSSTWDGVRVGSTKQDIFGLRGDGTTINWGYLYSLISSTPTGREAIFLALFSILWLQHHRNIIKTSNEIQRIRALVILLAKPRRLLTHSCILDLYLPF